ncbi:Transmembrane protein 19 [Diplodia seriata]|uniref:Transmembrane protein 19 n=1 Tax=Diplodia seriata TaxID=420778 RepID=A0A1S8BLH6_9PEZI|nr:Transmembrane protein 19 [Diplodia seriata]
MKPAVAVPATAALVYRAWSRKSLTPLGIAAAFLTAVVHAVHPWSVFYALLAVFFLVGTAATKVKHDVKARLTQSSSGASGGEGARTHVQVLANSLVASALILLHTWQLSHSAPSSADCWAPASHLPVVGIVANYAAVAADTLSSELGLLSKSRPRLITAPWRAVPPGTNGGVSAAGLLAAVAGAFVISLTAAVLTPFCREWDASSKAAFVAAMTSVGVFGSLLDSLLGALLQASVVDVRTGKVVEGAGGRKVPVHSAGSLHLKQRAKVRSAAASHEQGVGSVASSSGVDAPVAAKAESARKAGSILPEDGKHNESRRVETGRDILSNNGVNFVMAASASVVAMVGAAFVWDIPFSAIVAV